MKQIEEYEQPYNVVYGMDGGEQRIVPGPEGEDFPIWKARHMVMALLAAEATREGVTDDERAALSRIRNEFRYAEVGAMVMSGLVRRWKNRKGKGRFIGVVPKGGDYRDANSGAPASIATSERARNDRLDFGGDSRGPKTKKRPSDAERIAGKMAKASRKAAEGKSEG